MIPTALIGKGLRLFFMAGELVRMVIPTALIGKGLRRFDLFLFHELTVIPTALIGKGFTSNGHSDSLSVWAEIDSANSNVIGKAGCIKLQVQTSHFGADAPAQMASLPQLRKAALATRIRSDINDTERHFSTMYLQTIVCFANSRKEGRRCVAGKTWQGAGHHTWVRPVSRDATRALSPAVLAYQGGGQPSLLDIVRVPMHARLPEGHQQENSLVDDAYVWSKAGQLNWADISAWVDSPKQLWSLYSQSAGMLNNRVEAAEPVASSLQLISVRTVTVKLLAAPLPGNPLRRVVVAEFDYYGVGYRLHVTDSHIEAKCHAQPGQHLQIANAVLCVSLGACFRNHYYKLVASVLFERRFS